MRNWKSIFIATFWKENNYHQHDVLIHTVRVTHKVAGHGEWKMFMTGLLNGIGKNAVNAKH